MNLLTTYNANPEKCSPPSNHLSREFDDFRFNSYHNEFIENYFNESLKKLNIDIKLLIKRLNYED